MAKKKKPMRIDSLEIKSTPMLRKKGGPSSNLSGKRFGLGLTKFLKNLFVINELAPRSKKMTDAEIARQVRAEFAGYPAVVEKFSTDNPDLAQQMSRYRSEYNRGRLVMSEAPPKRSEISFQYDMAGNAINPKYKEPKPLSTEEMNIVRDKNEKFRQAWEDNRKAAR